jgi:hypothetical protein
MFAYWQARHKNYLGFRNGPVPWTGVCFRGIGSLIRGPRTTQELRSACAEPEFTRPSRRNLPTAWDDAFRRPERCWKSQTRRRKQWMRHVKFS